MGSFILSNMTWLQLVVFGVQIIFAVVAWAAKKEFVPRTEHDGLVQRVTVMELNMSHLPSVQTINNLTLQLASVSGELKVFEAKFDGYKELSNRIQKQVDRMDTFLRDERDK